MAKRQKKATEQTTEELAERLFPKKLKKALDEVAHQKDGKPMEKTS